ncbi:MAG TPA: molybdopterin cofactor-binding domain-containing protein [Gemmatimonadales bacterium]|nr:molybdopterin cofactor-binding domain-containing protein [Gemmatimonadales bacterium]
MNRRLFLVTSAAATGSLIIGAAPAPRRRAFRAGEPLAPGPFVRIDPDGSVTVVCARAEMGQGARAAIALLAAEELDADWDVVRVEQGDLDAKYGDQFAGGSAVVRTSWTPVRRAGAAARAMLVAAAARRWGVSEAECRTERGRVLHPRTRRRIAYGELVADARALPVPQDPPLKRPADYRLVGRGRANRDHPTIVRGAARFGMDTRVPGMLYAVVERAPVFGGRVAGVDDAAARAVPGVREVVIIDADAMAAFGENNPKPANGVAVVATSTWAAMQGRRALGVRWDHRGGEAESTAAMREACVARARAPDRFARTEPGVIEAALRRCERKLDVVYETPLLAHAPMEPMNCTADVRPTRCEVWAPTQMPEYVRTAAEKITGLGAGAITVHFTRMGGAFGRRFYADYAAEAIAVSKAVGAPVQVVWSREDDLRHGFYRPAGYHLVRGGLDGGGRIAVWEHRLFNASRGHYLGWHPEVGEELNPGEVSADDYPFALAPAQRVAYSPVESRIPRGQWRAVENSSNVFVTQSFIDELAHLAGADPLAFRLELIQRRREQTLLTHYEPDRLAAVFRLAGQRAGWGTPLPAGRGRGIAGCYANQSYVAQVAEVTARPDGTVRVDRLVAAVDCGLVVDPAGARAQVEGSIIQGLSAALAEEITVTGGRVDQGNFDAYPILRIGDAPRMETHFVPGGTKPGGLGEPALPPVAPAVANAIYAATGRRVRRLPLHGDPGKQGAG